MSAPEPGISAQWGGVCPRCDEPIIANVSRVVFARGAAIHVGCAAGADDE